MQCAGYQSISMAILWIPLSYARWDWGIARRVCPGWRQWLTIWLIAPALLLAGCATMLRVAENPAFQTAVQYGVVKYLSGQPDQQPRALEIVHYLQKAVDQEAQVTVSEIEDLAIDKIPWSELDLADQFLLRSMIEDIGVHLRERVGDGVLDDGDRVRLKEFLTWIEHAIHFAAK